MSATRHDERAPAHRTRAHTHATPSHPEDPLSAPLLEFDLEGEDARLRGEDVYARTGHDAITLVKYADLRIVLVALRSGARIGRHRSAGRAAIHVLSGGLLVEAAGKKAELGAGGLVALDCGVDHGVEARTDASFLLTIAAVEGRQP